MIHTWNEFMRQGVVNTHYLNLSDSPLLMRCNRHGMAPNSSNEDMLFAGVRSVRGWTSPYSRVERPYMD